MNNLMNCDLQTSCSDEYKILYKIGKSYLLTNVNELLSIIFKY